MFHTAHLLFCIEIAKDGFHIYTNYNSSELGQTVIRKNILASSKASRLYKAFDCFIYCVNVNEMQFDWPNKMLKIQLKLCYFKES